VIRTDQCVNIELDWAATHFTRIGRSSNLPGIMGFADFSSRAHGVFEFATNTVGR